MRSSRLRVGAELRERRNALLSSIYGGFTERFDTPDLRDARALLEELAEQRLRPRG